MKAKLPEAALSLPPQGIVEISNFASGYDDVVPLWFGESDVATPDFVVKAAMEACAGGQTTYPDVHGVAELRADIAAYVSSLHSVSVATDEILVTASGMEALSVTLRALIAPGDEVIVVRPAWENVINAARFLGATVREIHLELGSHGEWKLPLDAVRAAASANTKCILINSPNNPTGWTISEKEQRALLEIARMHGSWIISDEVYERVTSSGNCAPSMLRCAGRDDALVVINSFSKAWAMTGWRLGWIVAPKELVPVLGRIKEYSTSGTNPFVQAGGRAALHQGEAFIAQFNKYCSRGMEIVRGRLLEMPYVTAPKPDGAFYLIFHAEGLSGGVPTCKRLVAEHGVGIAPCDIFGGGLKDWFRICFAQSPKKLDQGLDRLTKGIKALRGNSKAA